MESRRNADLLQETRKLLNVLNDENSELKEQYQHVQEQLYAAHDAKARLEADMKKINLSLMEQLHKRTNACKEMEKQLKELQESTTKESRRSTDALTRMASLEAENSMLKENVRILHSQCESLTQQLVIAEEAAGSNRDQLAKTTHAVRVEAEREQSLLRERGDGLEATVRSLQQQLALISSEKGSLENTFNDLHAEHAALQEVYQREMLELQQKYRKGMANEADVAYLHGQLLDHSTEVSELFQAMRLFVQPLGDECDRNGEEISRLLLRISSLTESFNAIKMADDNILSALHSKLVSQNEDMQRLRAELNSAVQERMAAERRAQGLNQQLARYKGEIVNLNAIFNELQMGVSQSQGELESHVAALGEKDKEIENLRNAVGAEQRLNTQLRLELENAKTSMNRVEEAQQASAVELSREKSNALMKIGQLEHQLQLARNDLHASAARSSEMQRRYEEEIASLRDQVDEHTNTLANALGKLRSGSQRDSMSHAPSRSTGVYNGDSRATSLGGGSVANVAFRPSLLATAKRIGGENLSHCGFADEEGHTIEMD